MRADQRSAAGTRGARGAPGAAGRTGRAGGAGPPDVVPRYPLVRIYRATSSTPYQLNLATVSVRSGLPPDLVRRFVALGLVDAEHDALGRLRFRTTAPSAIARVQRLRTGLSLNYAAIGVVLDLLDRIDRLETALRHSQRAAEQRAAEERAAEERAAEERTPWT